MRGATSSDGKMSGNVQLISSYDKHRKSRHQQEGRAGGGDSGGVHDEGGHDEIKRVVEEHGPAHSHHVSRAEGGDGFHSMTEHEDGYEHEAEHGSLEEAHEHGKAAMDDTDHEPMNADTHRRAGERHSNEHHRSGSGSGSVDFLPGED